jgi:peroxiredoxin
MSTPAPTPAPHPAAERRPSLRPLIRVLLGLAAVVVVLNVSCQNPQPPEGRQVGDTCPQVAGQDVDGKPVKLTDYQGKVVMISFWGTWCPPCRKLLPHERQMFEEKYKDRPFQILGVAQDQPDTLRRFLKANPIPWPNIVDNAGVVSTQWNITAVPSAVLVDHTGVIRAAWVDGLNPNVLWAEVDKLVAEAERK